MMMEHPVTDDIGGRLRRAREQGGLSLGDVARRTKLTISVLEAIERNDFTSLPGGMFRKAYVRTLAVEVGLNPLEIAADYCARFETEPSTMPDPDAARPSLRRPIAALAALAVAAAAWFMLQPGPSPKVPFADAAGEIVAAPMQGAVSKTLTADSPRDATPTAIAARAADVPLRIELAATGWCWVAAETDGERVMYRLVRPGERVVLEGQRLISLRLGDAGSVTVSINGGARRSPGRQGEVVELEVTPDDAGGLRGVAVAVVSGN